MPLANGEAVAVAVAAAGGDACQDAAAAVAAARRARVKSSPRTSTTWGEPACVISRRQWRSGQRDRGGLHGQGLPRLARVRVAVGVPREIAPPHSEREAKRKIKMPTNWCLRFSGTENGRTNVASAARRLRLRNTRLSHAAQNVREERSVCIRGLAHTQDM